MNRRLDEQVYEDEGMKFERIINMLRGSLPKKVVLCASVYFAWTLMHYVATIFYAKICTPISLYGFVLSAVLVSSPQCAALRWMIYNGASKMTAMLFIIGGYILAYLENNWVIN
jgi:hypothetical protein